MQAADVIAHGEDPRPVEEALAQYVHASRSPTHVIMVTTGVGAPALRLAISCHRRCPTRARGRLSISPQCGFASQSQGFAWVSPEVRFSDLV